MPVLESTDKVAARSALRHRPIDEAANRPIVPSAVRPVVQRASRHRPQPADDDLISEWKRADVEAPVHVAAPQRKASSFPKKTPRTSSHPRARQARRFRAHPVLFLGLGMLAMLILWTLLSAGIAWWNNTLEYIHYGYPRTFQMDAVVGQNDSASDPSHFLAINFRGRIEIIEFPGGDASHARIYLGPQLFGPDADTTPVTLKFADINGDHKPDMFVFFQSSWIIFINDHGTFRPPTQEEQQEAVQYLAAHGQA